MSLQPSEVFRMRITNVWNSLPFSVVTAPPVKIDWINTGHYKNLNTIGKQNYQELGVEAELNFEFLYPKQRYGHRSTSLTPITSAMLCYVITMTQHRD